MGIDVTSAAAIATRTIQLFSNDSFTMLLMAHVGKRDKTQLRQPCLQTVIAEHWLDRQCASCRDDLRASSRHYPC
jgi:hypothetical protein